MEGSSEKENWNLALCLRFKSLTDKALMYIYVEPGGLGLYFLFSIFILFYFILFIVKIGPMGDGHILILFFKYGHV